MNEIVLRGIDGSSPLGFLAALGALRLLSLRSSAVRLHWRMQGVWQPVVSSPLETSEDEIIRTILGAPSIPIDIISSLGKNLTVTVDVFRGFVRESVMDLDRFDRRAADFAAAFGSEVCEEEKKNRIQYTSFCFITGSGHQNFLETASSLLKQVTPEHIRDALFGPWRFDKGFSMRWDPGDAREYALRWNDPGPEGARAVWGANRLAIEALPLFPAHPVSGRLETTGFRKHRPRDEFTWPVWVTPVSCDTVRSLVALESLQQDAPCRATLHAMGIAEVFRAERVWVGMGANRKVSFRAARAV